MEQKYINDLINSGKQAKVIVSNGFQMRGRILDQSDKAILIRGGAIGWNA